MESFSAAFGIALPNFLCLVLWRLYIRKLHRSLYIFDLYKYTSAMGWRHSDTGAPWSPEAFMSTMFMCPISYRAYIPRSLSIKPKDQVFAVCWFCSMLCLSLQVFAPLGSSWFSITTTLKVSSPFCHLSVCQGGYQRDSNQLCALLYFLFVPTLSYALCVTHLIQNRFKMTNCRADEKYSGQGACLAY